MVHFFDAARLATSTATVREFLTSFAVPVTTCPRIADEICVIARGDYRPLRVYINELPYVGAPLDLYYAQEFELVEYYSGSYTVRLYTTSFLERVARGKAFISPIL
jgi:hypothetical protein